MKSIRANSSIENLWDILNQNTHEVNRIICVYDDKEIIGIITDAEIRKFVSSTKTLPSILKDVTRTDFVHVIEVSDRFKMADSIMEQLEARKALGINPINEILVIKEGSASLVPISEFSTELNMINDRLFVVGLGFVGLTLFALLFSKVPRKNLFGVEKNEERIQKLLRREFYVSEPGLSDHLSELESKNLFLDVKSAWSGLSENLQRSIYLVSVQTPIDSKGSTYLGDLFESIRDIAGCLNRGDIVILRSTVPIGTTRRIASQIETLSGLKAGIDFSIGFAPERTVEGNALSELEVLPQIIGGLTETCSAKITEIVQRWNKSILVATSVETAEMIKLSNNAYRDHSFAFANELSLIAKKHRLDIHEIINLANLGYQRSNISLPSPGVGGPCLSKDSFILLSEFSTDQESNYANLGSIDSDVSTILSARLVNKSMPKILSERIENATSSTNNKGTVGLVVGLAFKGIPATNDCRNSPSVDIANFLKEKEINLFCWDAELSDLDIEKLGFATIPSSENFTNSVPEFCLIGNNHPLNMVKVRELVKDFNTIKCIHDPWDLVRNSGYLTFFKQREIEVWNMSMIL
jgi:UDP-N-acetyl-D-mannosaminuronic acid dehydrogenase